MLTVNPFSYLLPKRRNRSPVQTRDDAASREIVAALLARGYRYGETILNFPPEDEFAPRGEGALHPIDLSFLKPGLLLSMTRPPIDDQTQGDRKRVVNGDTDVEGAIVEAWREYLDIVSRSHVKLSAPMQRLLPPGFENRSDMGFRQNGSCCYKTLNDRRGSGWRKPERKDLTAAFVLRVDELPGVGAGLLNAFGMNAISTLVLAYRLARDWIQLLEKPGFTMLEMRTARVPRRPTDLRWAFDWDLEVLISTQL